DPDPVHAAVVDQRHGVAGDLAAVELHDAVVRLVRGRHLDLVDARAVAVTQREAGPRAGQARRDDQRVAAAPEAEDALDGEAPQPRRGARVPCPAAAALV